MSVIEITAFLFNGLFEVFKNKETAYLLVIAMFVAAIVVGVAAFVSYNKNKKEVSRILKNLKEVVKKNEQTSSRRESFAEKYESISENFKNSPLEHSWFEFEEVIIQDTSSRVIKNTVRPHNFFHLSDIKYSPAVYSSWPNVFVGLGLLFTFIGLAAALNGAAVSIAGDIKVAQEGLKTVLEVASVKFITSITGLGLAIILSAFIRLWCYRLESLIDDICINLEKCMKALTSQSLQEDQLKELKQQTKILSKFTDDFAVTLGEEVQKGMSAALGNSVKGVLSDGAMNHIDSVSQTIGDMKTALSDIADKLSSSGDGFVDSMSSAAAKMQNVLEGNLEESAQKIKEAMSGTAEGLEKSLAEAGNSFSQILLESSSQMKAATGELSGNISQFVRGIDNFDKQIMANIEGFERGTKSINETISALDGSASSIRAASEPIASVAEEFSKSSTAILSASESITTAYESIKDINVRIDEYTKTIASSWGEYRDRFEGVDENLAGIFKEFDSNVETILGRMQSFSQELDSAFDKGGSKLGEAVASLRDSVDELVDNRDTIKDMN